MVDLDRLSDTVPLDVDFERLTSLPEDSGKKSISCAAIDAVVKNIYLAFVRVFESVID
jgi:hypothetical protein